jgi:hypothetical protein
MPLRALGDEMSDGSSVACDLQSTLYSFFSLPSHFCLSFASLGVITAWQ